jgi:hypothetical protein
MYKDLSHLKEEQIEELMNRYYKEKRVSDLIKEYDLDISVSKLYKFFPVEVLHDICPYCHVNFVKIRPSKSGFVYDQDTYCPKCGHMPLVHWCNCNNCQQKAESLSNAQRTSIKKTFTQKSPVNFSDLSFRNKVFLGALCTALQSKDLEKITLHEGSGKILAPTHDLTQKIYSDLLVAKVLEISPDSSLDAFVFDSQNTPVHFDYFKVIYNLNLNFFPTKQDVCSAILTPHYYSSAHSNEALELWKEIAIAECTEYLSFKLSGIYCEFNFREYALRAFDEILNLYSVSQVYAIIYHSIIEISKRIMQRQIRRAEAAENVIRECIKFIYKAQVKKWDISSFNRDKKLPQSTLSHFYFFNVLGIGEKVFKDVPATSNLPSIP